MYYNNKVIANQHLQRFKLRGPIILALVAWSTPIYVRLFKRKTKAWGHTNTNLLQLPKGSLGHELGVFLKKENLEPMPKLEDHDIMHLVFDFPTTIIGELRMQFFLVGNGKRSFYAYATILLGLFMVPEFWETYYQEYKRGQACLNFSKWKFQHLLHEPIAVLRQQLSNEETKEPPLFI